MGHSVLGTHRYMTMIGLLVVTTFLLLLLQLSTKTQVLRYRDSSRIISLENKTLQVVSRDDSFPGCQGNEKTMVSCFKESPELEFKRNKCLEDIRARMITDYKPFFENVRAIALVDVALHDNMGDSILWRAAIHLSTIFGHTVNYVCTGSQKAGGHLKSFPQCNTTKLINFMENRGLVMYHGGGNWGDLYRPIQEYRMQMLKELGDAYNTTQANFKVIQLPQSIVYATNNHQNYTYKDDVLVNSLPDQMFTLFTRQDDSLVWATHHYKDNIGIRMSPDIAFILGALSPTEKPIKDVIFIMRRDFEDNESDTNLKSAVAERFNGTGLTYSFQGYNYANHSTEYVYEHPTLVSDVRLQSVIRTISKGRLLITNRFHGHVIGMMMGKTTFWIDTVQKKIGHSRTVAFDSSEHCTDKAMRSFEFPSTLDAVDAAIKYLIRSQT
eukprot:g4696.t1